MGFFGKFVYSDGDWRDETTADGFLAIDIHDSDSYRKGSLAAKRASPGALQTCRPRVKGSRGCNAISA
jgi:hypothetical protein